MKIVVYITVEFAFNDAFLSVLAEFLSFTCIQVRQHNNFSYIVTLSIATLFVSPCGILLICNNTCKFSSQFEV